MDVGAAELDQETLIAIAEGIASGDPCGLVPDGDDRRWALALQTEHYAVWVIAWPPGTGLAMHDHDDSAAIIRVVRGELRERYTQRSLDGAPPRTRWLMTGDRYVLATDHVHEVVNLGAEEAVTVHVYSPPIADMTFRTDPEIDLRAGRAQRQATATH